MGFRAAIRIAEGIVEIVLADRVTADDIVGAMAAYASIPGFRADMHRLYRVDPLADLSDLSIDDLRSIHGLPWRDPRWREASMPTSSGKLPSDATRAGYRIAVVAREPAHWPIMRLYRAIWDENPEKPADFRLFFALEAAEAWLSGRES